MPTFTKPHGLCQHSALHQLSVPLPQQWCETLQDSIYKGLNTNPGVSLSISSLAWNKSIVFNYRSG